MRHCRRQRARAKEEKDRCRRRNGATPGRKAPFLSSAMGRLSPAALFFPRDNPRLRVCVRLRGKDSNLDYLIQSQASYH